MRRPSRCAIASGGEILQVNVNVQDLKGVVAVSNQYCTIEKFVEAYCDLHIYKIGARYKAIMSVG